MRKMFTQSHETQKLIELFVGLPIGSPVSFADASKRVGFRVYSSLPAYQTAKRIAERDHNTVVDGIRTFGFVRVDGSGMVARAPRFFKKVRKGAKREAHVQEIAISQNLTRGEMVVATEQLSRLRILQTTASVAKAATNRPDVFTPAPVKTDSRSSLREAMNK